MFRGYRLLGLCSAVVFLVMAACGPTEVCQLPADCPQANALCLNGRCALPCKSESDCSQEQLCQSGVCRQKVDGGPSPDQTDADQKPQDDTSSQEQPQDTTTPDKATPDAIIEPRTERDGGLETPSPDNPNEATPETATTERHPDAAPDSTPPEGTPEQMADLGPCTPQQQQPCYSGFAGSAGIGNCKEGIRYCTTKGTWGPCIGEVTPKTELCNGSDDDCDGQIDEDFTTLGGSCLAGKGECQAQGRFACRADGKDVYCSATQGTPLQELCDGKDNDCDGVLDNGFTNLHQSCFAGIGECRRQGRVVCKGDGTGTECTAQAGASRVEICDGKDNDCDGKTDEDWPTLGTPCQGQNQSCTITGKIVCKTDGTGVTCDVPNTISTEICDGIDNDCDGQVDEDFPTKGVVCVSGKGLCARQGTNICANDGKSVVCSAIPGQPATEICDGLDNDCDGQIDENWPLKGTPCTVGQGACKTTTTYQCRLDGTDVECVSKIQPVAELCNNIDDDCDGQIDEDFPTKGQPCTDNTACGGQPCACNKGIFRCTANQSKVECYTQTSASPEICDQIDNDCDGQVDEDLGTYTCGVGACESTGQNCVNGQKGPCTPKAPGTEICDKIDNNCDGQVDEGCTCRPSQLTFTLERGHNSNINTAQFSNDGKMVGTTGNDNLIKFWDTRTGIVTKEITITNGSPQYLQFSPDGLSYAYVKSGLNVEVRDFATHSIIRTISHSSSLPSIQFSADSQFVLGLSNTQDTILIWKVSTGAFIGSLQHTERIYSFKVSPDHKTLAAAHNNSVSLWDFTQATLLRKQTIGGASAFYATAFTPDSKTVLLGDSRGKIYLIDVSAGTLLHTFTDHTTQIMSMDVSANGLYLVSSSADRTTRLWDLTQKTLLKIVETTEQVNEFVQFAKSGLSFLTFNRNDRWVTLWEAPDGRLLRRIFGHYDNLTYAHLSRNGDRFLSFERNTAYIWKMAARHLVTTSKDTSATFRHGQLTPDGKVAVLAYQSGSGNTIKIINADNGSLLRTLPGHNSTTWQISMDQQGISFASRGNDNDVKIWEIATGKLLQTINFTDNPQEIVISPNGSLVAVLLPANPYRIEVWDITQKQKLHSYTVSSNIRSMRALTIDHQGKRIAFADGSNKINTWEFATSTTTTVYTNTPGSIQALEFSHDGEFLAARSGQYLYIYSTQNQRLLETLTLGNGSHAGLNFSQDGKTLFAGGTDRRIYIFECPCNPAATRPCYAQIEGTPGKGICTFGTQTCDSNQSWGVCTGDTGSKVETYDGTDEDCNGYIDDPFADLHISTITATPSTLQVGDNVTLQVCVTNKGQSTSESNPAKVRLYLGLQASDIPNAAQLLTGSATTPADLQFPSLKANTSSCQNFSFQLPFIFPGQRYIGGFVDVDKQVPETDETNNISSTTITVNP